MILCTRSRSGLILFVALLLSGCGEERPPAGSIPETSSPHSPPESLEIKTGPDGKPIPPYTIAPGPPPTNTALNGRDVSRLSGDQLRGIAYELWSEGNFADAVRMQRLAIEKGDDSFYSMACYFARNRQVDQAFHWLQRAALEEGVDAEWAAKDADLTRLWSDRRWTTIQSFLKATNEYWRKSNTGKTLLGLPKGYRKGTAIPVVVWLHGRGASPDNLIATHQEFADRHQVAFVGISGTYPTGPKGYVWAEDPRLDAQRIERALQEVADRLTIDPAQVILLGFSQGAHVGAEVLARHPDKYAGVIALSPGTDKNQITNVSPSLVLQRRTLIAVCGEKEHPDTIECTDTDAAWYRKAGAHVIHRKYPGMSRHTFPDDYFDQLPKWINLIVRTAG